MKVARVEEMKNMDQDAIKKYGINNLLLMENAGLAVCQIIRQKYGFKKYNFLIFCGTGNNGGDGLVVARKLYSNGAHVQLCILSNPEKYKNVSLKNWQIIQKLNIPFYIKPSVEEIDSLIKPDNVMVDAIFGTGLTREITGYYFQLIQMINQKTNPVVSVDIPSGINGNNGTISGIAVKADHTVTFGLPKLGNILYPGYKYNGSLSISHISFPPELYNTPDIKIHINTPVTIPERQENGHKGTFGNALFIAGAQNYYGAPSFSSLSFLKAGGGYSRLAVPASIIPYIASKASEVVFLPQKETNSGTIALENLNELLEWAEKMDFVIIGPGLSLQEETQSLVRDLIIKINKPLLIDGDGLTALSKDISILKKRKKPTILTPHPGEMSRLIGQSVQKIKENQINIIQKFSKNNNTICILKGPHTVIGLPNGELYINMTGNCGMASAGSGDVLTGTIAAMYTLGLSIESAARQGTLVHGVSGDLSACKTGKDGMIAQDILDSLPEAMKVIRENQKKEKENQCNFFGFNVI